MLRSEVAMTYADKESEARCKEMLNQLIAVVKKQTMEMEDLAGRMNELAVGLKAVVQPRRVPDHTLPPSVTASTPTLVVAVDHAVAAPAPASDAALAPESPSRCTTSGPDLNAGCAKATVVSLLSRGVSTAIRAPSEPVYVASSKSFATSELDNQMPTECSMIGSDDDTASQTSAFMSNAAPGSPSTIALLDVANTSLELTVATLRVRDDTSDLTAHQLLDEMPQLAKVDSTTWLRPSARPTFIFASTGVFLARVAPSYIEVRDMCYLVTDTGHGVMVGVGPGDAVAGPGQVSLISIDQGDVLACTHVLCPPDDHKVLWPPPMRWVERRSWLPPAHTEITGDSVEPHPQSWRLFDCYQGEVQSVPPWPPPQGPERVLKMLHKQARVRSRLTMFHNAEMDILNSLVHGVILEALGSARKMEYCRASQLCQGFSLGSEDFKSIQNFIKSQMDGTSSSLSSGSPSQGNCNSFISLDCGGADDYTDGIGIQWTSDAKFVLGGQTAKLLVQDQLQKQHIAIARAVIKNPAILLLDEATSALDSESEKLVQQALDQASMGRTTLVVAHKLSTVKNADQIAVVDGGTIAEIGTHDELINKGGPYSRLVKLQKTVNYIDQESDQVRASSVARTSTSGLSMSRASPMPLTPGVSKETDSSVSSPEPSFSRLLAMNAPEWRQAVIGSLSALVYGSLQPIYAITIGGMIAAFFVQDHNEMNAIISHYALIFCSLSVISIAVNLLQHYNFAYMGENLVRRIRVQVLEKILTFEAGWFDEETNSSGALCSRLSNEASLVKTLVADRISLLLQTTSGIIIAVTIGLVVARKLALVMIVVQPSTMICYYAKKIVLSNVSRDLAKAQHQSTQIAIEAVYNHRLVTSFGCSSKVLQLFEHTQEKPLRKLQLVDDGWQQVQAMRNPPM